MCNKKYSGSFCFYCLLRTNALRGGGSQSSLPSPFWSSFTNYMEYRNIYSESACPWKFITKTVFVKKGIQCHIPFASRLVIIDSTLSTLPAILVSMDMWAKSLYPSRWACSPLMGINKFNITKENISPSRCGGIKKYQTMLITNYSLSDDICSSGVFMNYMPILFSAYSNMGDDISP